MNDLEVFAEKGRAFAAEVQKLEDEKRSLAEERRNFEQEVRNVGEMAAEVEHRSEELRVLHHQAGEARGEILRLRDQLSEERGEHDSELERLKTMQTLVEQQRLQLLQTENQCRMRGIEDIDFMITTQATIPSKTAGAVGDLAEPVQDPVASLNQPASAPFAGAVVPVVSSMLSGRGIANLGHRLPATAGRAGSTGHRLQSGADALGARMELQTLLRRTREASGDVVHIQEQFRFLQQSQPTGQITRDDRMSPFTAAAGGHAGLASDDGRQPPGMLLLPPSRTVPGDFHGMQAPSFSTSTEEDYFAELPLEGIHPLSSDSASGVSGTT